MFWFTERGGIMSRILAILSMLVAVPFVSLAADAGMAVAPSTNQPASDEDLKAKLKDAKDKARENRAKIQAERTNVMNAAWSKDEPRIFEWDVNRCREELPKAKEREARIREDLIKMARESKTLGDKIKDTDPELKPLKDEVARITDEIARLNSQLTAKRQELAKKGQEKAAASPELKAIEKRGAELTREYRTAASGRARIEARLTKLTTGQATNKVGGVELPKKDGAGK